MSRPPVLAVGSVCISPPSARSAPEGTGRAVGVAYPPGVWSNAGVFVRVWEYEVPSERAEAFTAAYAADGAWGKLFGRAAGYLSTELYHDAARGDRYLTIDRWRDEQDWRSFLRAFGSAYESLDAQLEGLAVAERSLFEGSS